MTRTLEQKPPAPPLPPRQFSRLGWLTQAGPVFGLLAIVLFFSAMRYERFVTLENAQIMLKQTAVVGTAALGMTLIIISGGIDLSVSSTIALTAVMVALLLRAGCSPAVAALGGAGVGALCGAFIGILVTQLRLAPFIVTLGTWGAYRGIAKGIAGEQMVRPPSDTWLESLLRLPGPGNRWILVSPGVWITFGLGIVVALILRYTRFGRHVFAIGSSEATARLCGVPVNRTKIWIYLVGGIFAGFAGVMQFSQLHLGDPMTAVGMELDIIAAVVIGGASLNGGSGSIFGTLVGAILMVVVANGCQKMDLSNWVQEIITGAIIVLAAAIDRIQHGKQG